METILLECIQCQSEFEYSPAEQEYHDRMGFDDPKRCPYCRKHKTKVADNHRYDGRSRKQHERNKHNYEIEY